MSIGVRGDAAAGDSMILAVKVMLSGLREAGLEKRPCRLVSPLSVEAGAARIGGGA